MASNRLRLNPDKTEFIWFASPHHLRSFQLGSSLSIGSTSIIPSSSVRDLGVYFDNVLNLNEHVNHITKLCYFELRQLRHICRALSKSNIKTLLHAFVSSRLDYCNSLFAGQPIMLISKLQSVQNAAARLYAGLSKYSHVSSVLRDDLHWLRIPQRVSYKLCILVYRCLHNLAPAYLSESTVKIVNSNSRAAFNRSAALGNLLVPRTRTKTYGSRTFRVSGPVAWNALPVALKQEGSFESFKSSLKTHLFVQCYG
jgi:acyl-CoA thioesterase FadM